VAVEFGADDFLGKPVEPEWLRAKVERYLLQPEVAGVSAVSDRYEVGSQLFGGYYRAQDRRLRRSVLLKFGGEEREALALASFSHPHLLAIYDHEPGYLVLEDYGLQVLEAVPASPHSAVTAIGAMLGLVEAVESLHRGGFLHLGLHPGLLLGRPGGVLKICDLSGILAHPLDASVAEFYARSGYAAPEQVDPRFGEPGPRSDQFALAGILYFLLTGEAPSPGCLATAFGEPPGLLKQLPWIDPRLEATCKKAMARHPSQRFASLAAFRSALRPSLAEAIAQTRTA
jgi:serine/threonine protein kinase